MISLEKCKELLEDNAQKYTDEEIEQIRDDLYQLVELAFESWKQGRLNKKIPQK